MNMNINTDVIQSPHIYGELLRHYAFVPDENGGEVGCYTTFKLRPEFRKLEGKPAEQFVEEFLRSETFWGEWYKAPNLTVEDYSMQLEMLNNFLKNIYSNGEITLAWYWDGDGTLLIGDNNRVAFNSDCKTDYSWEWIKQ